MDIEKEFAMRKKTMELAAKRHLAYVYLLHRMFKCDFLAFVRTMYVKDLTEETLRDWDRENREKVLEIIKGEDEQARLSSEDAAVPTIKSIKEKALSRINGLVNLTDDPARLAQVYKTLSEFESVDDRKEKSVVDAVNENVQPLMKKDEEKPVSIMDVLVAQGKAVPMKKRGRPRKADSQKVDNEEV